MIVTATISDAEKLTDLAIKSKSYWGYSEELLQSWKLDLTVSCSMIKNMYAYKYILNKEIVGFYILNKPFNNNIEIEFLFVLPNFIGKGIGSKLLNHAITFAKDLQCNTMSLLADPNAVPFYASKQFVVQSLKESAVPNRFLPYMTKDL